MGIDVIPAQPPRGASAIQGNFLSAEVQAEVRSYVRDYWKGRAREGGLRAGNRDGEGEGEDRDGDNVVEDGGGDDAGMRRLEMGVVEMGLDEENTVKTTGGTEAKRSSRAEADQQDGRVVDVVLSDMSAPWEQTTGGWIRSVSNPYFRMMNTSGMAFRDHAGSMVCRGRARQTDELR